MKYIKYILLALLLIGLIAFAYIKFGVSESRPTIVKGADAELMATKMLTAVNKQAWDTLPYIQWTFRGSNHYVWDRINNKALIKWDQTVVHLDPDQVAGRAFVDGKELEGDAKTKAIQVGWGNWCNDMFWLSAPYKIRDKGTKLSVAKDSEGKEGLLVSYETGGVTPGDNYLWFLDETGLPTGYKMWVSIIPVGGIYTSWEDWITLPGGSKIAQSHQGNLSALAIPISDVKGGFSWSDLGYDASPIQL